MPSRFRSHLGLVATWVAGVALRITWCIAVSASSARPRLRGWRNWMREHRCRYEVQWSDIMEMLDKSACSCDGHINNTQNARLYVEIDWMNLKALVTALYNIEIRTELCCCQTVTPSDDCLCDGIAWRHGVWLMNDLEKGTQVWIWIKKIIVHRVYQERFCELCLCWYESTTHVKDITQCDG